MARYVKFVRGTPEAFQNLIKKDQDTLYFIRDNDADDLGALYLGNTLISGNGVDLGNLGNVILEKLQDKDLLSYDSKTNTWVNKSITDTIGYFTNNAHGGLVPTPLDENPSQVFLRGDGVWARLENQSADAADNKTIELINGTISLKDFGKRYYKYVSATGTEGAEDYVAAHYELQVVDSAHPWKTGLEPRTVFENNEYVLGWFEPNLESVKGLSDSINILSSKVVNLESILNSTQVNIETITSNLTTIDKKIVNLEDKLNNVYTKNEVDGLIANIKPVTNPLFTAVNDEEFLIDDNKTLNIKNISIAKVANLENILNSKASQEDLIALNTRVDNLDFVTHAELEESIKKVNQSSIWGEL